MRYRIRGAGSVTLSQDDFIFQGGEGKVYGKGETAYKIYDDPGKMIPEAKIAELAAIPDPRVIRPEAVVVDAKGRPVGFTMKWIRESVPLARLFTGDFRKRNGVADEAVAALVTAMREGIAAIHGAGCLMVDGNEFNYLADHKTFRTPYFIDVNAYQTPSFPATVILPSVRDPHASGFSELTDWFSFGVVACQLFAGIHPYKGKHPAYTRKKMGDDLLKNRMRDNISIFNPEVSVPPSTRDLDRIPGNDREWFVDLFEKGVRRPPPMVPGGGGKGRAAVRVIQTADGITVRRLHEFDDEVIAHRVVFGREVTRTLERIYIDGAAHPCAPDADVVFTPLRARPVLVCIEAGRLRFAAPPGSGSKVRGLPLECSEKMVVDNTLLVRNRGDLTALSVSDRPDGGIGVSVRAAWKIMPNASQVFDGVVLQNVLGKPYLMIPWVDSGGKVACANLHVPELAGLRVVDARHENRVCMVLAHGGDGYCRLTLTFDEGYRRYRCRREEDAAPNGVNFTVLDNGVAVAIPEDGRMEVFTHHPADGRVEVVRDPGVLAAMRLCKNGVETRVFRGRELHAIRKGGTGGTK